MTDQYPNEFFMVGGFFFPQVFLYNIYITFLQSSMHFAAYLIKIRL